MDLRYLDFCLADPIFYDSLSRLPETEHDFSIRRSCPPGWTLRKENLWTFLAPPIEHFPTQGWKIHVSATIENSVDTLDTVWDYCTARNISFKFLRNRLNFIACNAKYADRGRSGKFITIYPVDDEELERTLRELGGELAGRSGPYILNDARWGEGPLFVRYGGFVIRHCRSQDGDLVPAIEDPDGHLIPDPRRPAFEVPSWAKIPDVLASCVAARTGGEAPDYFPFRIQEPLHFSNGGGIYRAEDLRTGEQVVLREARPFAGIDTNGHDAVHRLNREREFLEKLADIDVVPDFYEYFTCWEHHFLVEEYIDGESLNRATVARAPLIHPDASDEDVADYTRWALDVLTQVRQGLRQLHDAGVVFGDLHPLNIVIRPNGTITFVDFELASYATDETTPTMGAPGYVPPDRRTGVDADLYALACLHVSTFLPLTSLFSLDPAKAKTLVHAIVERFPVPTDFAPQVLSDLRLPKPRGTTDELTRRRRVTALTARLDAGRPDWPAIRESAAAAILTSTTPERADRLFPGDVNQFTYGGLGLAYGAAGVLYALAKTGAGRFPDHERWLLDAVHSPGANQPPGFYNGLHGIAYVLEELGRHDDAMAILEQAMETGLDDLSADLMNGLPGIGLNLLHFARITDDATLRTEALKVADRLAGITAERGTAQDETDPARPKRLPRAGLFHGPSGRALFYLRLYGDTGDGEYLHLAEDELRRDVDQCVPMEDGTLQMNEGWRVMPYIETGSTGVALVLHEFLALRQHEDLAQALTGMRRAAEPEFIICPGLLNGRAGLILFLSLLRDTDPDPQATLQPVIERHLRRLAWHIVYYDGHVAFPGDQLLRLSMDLATGSAGILCTLSAVLDHNTAILPFLGRK